MPHRKPNTIPNARQALHYEQVCRYLNAQPYCAVTFPFPSDPPITAKLLQRIAVHRLVRHTPECRWQLAKHWQPILRRLWSGVPDMSDPPPPDPLAGDPFVADTNVDTLYVNLPADALPPDLLRQCVDVKHEAQAADQSIETPWTWYGAPLSMHKAGVGTTDKGNRASWGYILRNEEVMVLLSKKPYRASLARCGSQRTASGRSDHKRRSMA